LQNLPFFQCVDLRFTNYNPSLITMAENTICFTFYMSTPLVDPIFYHKVACKLWHLATTCLKVAYAMTIVSHYFQIHQQSHLDVATTIFQMHFELCGLLAKRGYIISIGFIDVNYVGDWEEHKSRLYFFSLSSGPISWSNIK
jgi:hypothetical protein